MRNDVFVYTHRSPPHHTHTIFTFYDVWWGYMRAQFIETTWSLPSNAVIASMNSFSLKSLPEFRLAAFFPGTCIRPKINYSKELSIINSNSFQLILIRHLTFCMIPVCIISTFFSILFSHFFSHRTFVNCLFFSSFHFCSRCFFCVCVFGFYSLFIAQNETNPWKNVKLWLQWNTIV